MLIEQDESLSATLRLKRVNQGVLYDRTLILVIVTDNSFASKVYTGLPPGRECVHGYKYP
jgi:hypothetical protein